MFSSKITGLSGKIADITCLHLPFFIRSRYKKITSVRKNIVHRRQINRIIRAYKPEYIIIHPPLIDWEIPLFQRPQQMSLALSKLGCLVFYGTWNHYDKVDGLIHIRDNCYVTNRYDILKKLRIKKIIDHYSTSQVENWEDIREELDQGNIVVYEYIDDLNEDISGEISENTMIKHRNILKNEECIVLASADKLFDEVSQKRKRNFSLVTNGVDLSHFSVPVTGTIPEKIKEILEKGKPILGYYGSIASWFDFDLIRKISDTGRYEIVILGWDYDGSLSQLTSDIRSNVHYLGTICYQELPSYAIHFSVSTIPFKINEVTVATSPVKLFEYMALGNPILTTNMPECGKYRSVIRGMDHDDFISKIEYCLSLRKDPVYKDLLRQEARENTWESKALEMKRLIEFKLKPASIQK